MSVGQPFPAMPFSLNRPGVPEEKLSDPIAILLRFGILRIEMS